MTYQYRQPESPASEGPSANKRSTTRRRNGGRALELSGSNLNCGLVAERLKGNDGGNCWHFRLRLGPCWSLARNSSARTLSRSMSSSRMQLTLSRQTASRSVLCDDAA